MVHEISPWRNRFEEPTPEMLRDGLKDFALDAFDTVRSRFGSMDGVFQTVAWYGHSWCWSVEFRIDGIEDPLAILVPSPDEVQLAMPLDQEFVDGLPVKRLKRAVRDGLDLGCEPFDTRLGFWFVEVGLIDDLTSLVKRRLDNLAAAAS